MSDLDLYNRLKELSKQIHQLTAVVEFKERSTYHDYMRFSDDLWLIAESLLPQENE